MFAHTDMNQKIRVWVAPMTQALEGPVVKYRALPEAVSESVGDTLLGMAVGCGFIKKWTGIPCVASAIPWVA